MANVEGKGIEMASARRLTAYTANPFGFSEVTRSYMASVFLPSLRRVGIEPINPWELISQTEIAESLAVEDCLERERSLARLAESIGRRNIEAILVADILIANLDGQEPDSGTVSEVAFATGVGKRVYAWRSDFRRSGEFNCVVNLQVEAFIRHSGGPAVFKSLQDLLARVVMDYDLCKEGM